MNWLQIISFLAKKELPVLMAGSTSLQLDVKKTYLFWIGSSWSYSVIDCLLATALRIRGHNILMLICDGLPITEDAPTGGGQYDPAVEFEKKVSYVEAFNLPWKPLPAFVSDDMIDNARQAIACHSYEELNSYVLNGISIGELALASTCYRQGFPSVPGIMADDVCKETFVKFFLSTYLLTESCRKALASENPDVVVSVGGKSAMWAPILELAEKQGRSIVNWEDISVSENGFVFSNQQPAVRFHLEREWNTLKKDVLTESQQQEVYSYYSRWKNGETTPFKYYEEPLEETDEIKQILSINDNQPLVSVFPNIVREDNTLQGYKRTVYSNQVEWIISLIHYARKRSDIQFVIRFHPAENKLPASYILNRLEDLVRNYIADIPSNVHFVPPESNISSYALADMSDVLMVWSGTLGLEFALEGRRVLVCGDPGYKGKGFTTDANNELQMYSKLEESLIDRQIPEEAIKSAQKYVYLSRLRAIVEMPFHDGHKKRTFSIPSFQQLMPGQNAVIDDLCDCMINNKPFLDIGNQGKSTMGKIEPDSEWLNKSILEAERLFKAQEYAGVVDLCQSVLQQSPDNSAIYNVLGATAFATGMNDLAVKYLKKAVDIEPSQMLFLTNLAMAYSLQGNINSALSCYDRVLAFEKDNTDICKEIGKSLLSFDIAGWFNPLEAAFLYTTALSSLSYDPVIVELGSYMGLSSMILAKGIRNKERGKVYCIDPWMSEVESLTDGMRSNILDLEGQGTNAYDKFIENMEMAGVLSDIMPVRGYSADIAKGWSKPIDVLFIDADHSYEATLADFDNWIRFVKTGGTVIFHDVELPSSQAKYYAGPGRVIEERIMGNPAFEKGTLEGYIYSVRKKEMVSNKGNPAHSFSGNKPKVSVICCTYNRPELVQKALSSLAIQTTREFEVVVVNDGGVDIGQIVKRELADVRYQYHSFTENRGLAQAINFAIEQSKGDYLMFIDDDNEYLPDHIAVLKEALESSGAPMAYSDSIWRYFKNGIRDYDGIWEWDYSPNTLNFQNYIDPVQVILDKKQLKQFGDFDHSLHVSDWDLWVRFRESNSVVHVPKTTSVYGLYDTVKRISADFDFTDDTKKMINKYAVSSSPYLREFAASLAYASFKDFRLFDSICSDPALKDSLTSQYLFSQKLSQQGKKEESYCILKEVYKKAKQQDPVFSLFIAKKMLDYFPVGARLSFLESIIRGENIRSSLHMAGLAYNFLNTFFKPQFQNGQPLHIEILEDVRPDICETISQAKHYVLTRPDKKEYW